jgi:hypothetical protein
MNLRDAMRTRINLLGHGLHDTHQINQAMGGSDVKMFALTDSDPDWVGPLKTAPRRKTNLLTILRSYFHFFGYPRKFGAKYVKPLLVRGDWMSMFEGARRAHLPRYVYTDVSGLQDTLRDSNFTVPVLFLDPDAPDGNEGLKNLYREHSGEFWDIDFYVVEDDLTVVADVFDISEPSFSMVLPEVLRNPHEDSFKTLSLSDGLDEDKLKKHYIGNLFPLVGRLDHHTYGKSMGRLKPNGPFFKEVRIYSRSARASEGLAEVVQILSPLAKKYRDHLFHVAVIDDGSLNVPKEEYNFFDGDEFRGPDIMSELRLGLTYHEVRPPPQTDKRFTMRKENSVENIAAFIEEVAQGRHQAKYKSQDIPSVAEPGRAQVIVNEDFKNWVMEGDKDVFVLFYSVYSQASMGALGLWERLAAMRYPGIVFATFDIRENDFPDEALGAWKLIAAYDIETRGPGGEGKGLPGMIYYKKNAAHDPALYSGPHDMKELEDFVKEALANPAKPGKSKPVSSS